MKEEKHYAESREEFREESDFKGKKKTYSELYERLDTNQGEKDFN